MLLSVVVAVLKVHFKANHIDIKFTTLIPDCIQVWKASFLGQIPDRLVFADELKGSLIDLEGHNLVAVELAHTDTARTNCLNVPSIGLVVTFIIIF